MGEGSWKSLWGFRVGGGLGSGLVWLNITWGVYLMEGRTSTASHYCLWENCHNEENSDRQRKFFHRGHVSPKTRPSHKPNQPHRTARVVEATGDQIFPLPGFTPGTFKERSKLSVGGIVNTCHKKYVAPTQQLAETTRRRKTKRKAHTPLIVSITVSSQQYMYS